jgi:hypothetical protein
MRVFMNEMNNIVEPVQPPGRELRARCENCFGLCCTALPFSASADFAATKQAGTPCGHLREDYRCGVHDRLRVIGYRGCTVYDCFGAGQRISSETYKGRSWREEPGLAGSMFDAFSAMRLLHELLWYLGDAIARSEAPPFRAELAGAMAAAEAAASLPAERLAEADTATLRMEANKLLMQCSELARAEFIRKERRAFAGNKRKPIGPRADLMGANLRNMDLRGANLRGAYLIAANLAGADLRLADLIGADMRDADLRGANLSDSLFLTQFQINSAKGDARTLLPRRLERPPYWR